MTEEVNGGTPHERDRPPLPVAVGVLVLLVVGIIWWVAITHPSQAGVSALPSQAAGSTVQPATIDNLVLEEGPEPMTTGGAYHSINTRAEDPSPLTTAELSQVFPPGKGTGPMEISPDCAGAVTGALIIQALNAAGCDQVLRVIITCTGGTSCTSLIDIFNLTGGPSLTQAARAFGQEPGAGGTIAFPFHPPNSAPDGFILPWHGITAADIASASGNAADVDAFGHLLVVLWTYSPDGGSLAAMGASAVNGLIETAELSQFADDRADNGLTR
jgi:hypothetical protein